MLCFLCVRLCWIVALIGLLPRMEYNKIKTVKMISMNIILKSIVARRLKMFTKYKYGWIVVGGARITSFIRFEHIWQDECFAVWLWIFLSYVMHLTFSDRKICQNYHTLSLDKQAQFNELRSSSKRKIKAPELFIVKARCCWNDITAYTRRETHCLHI